MNKIKSTGLKKKTFIYIYVYYVFFILLTKQSYDFDLILIQFIAGHLLKCIHLCYENMNPLSIVSRHLF